MQSTYSNPESRSFDSFHRRKCELVEPNTFKEEHHFYPKAVHAHLSEIVKEFMTLGKLLQVTRKSAQAFTTQDTPQLVKRFCELHPNVQETNLMNVLTFKPQFFNWSGSDLFHVSDHTGSKSMVLIETNSCPSGQKAMPKMDSMRMQHDNVHRGYRTLIENMFKPMLEQHERMLGPHMVKDGKLAVVYDKNKMETWGYAAIIADVFRESVYLVEYKNQDDDPSVRFVGNNQIMQIRDVNNQWMNIRACFRYVTQKPWNRLPISKIRTLIINPVVCCLAGGRNKQLAAIAFSKFNMEKNVGIQINTPKTVYNVEKQMIPYWITYFGGIGVIKNPYSNAGQGVWVITNTKELKQFMDTIDSKYEKFVVQSMIGCKAWKNTHFYHVGTVPDKDNNVFVADLRMMVHFDYTMNEFRPLALFARKARKPLQHSMNSDNCTSWDMFGTNLTLVGEKGSWDTDQSRLITCDEIDFPTLGLTLDNLIEAFVQSVLANVAIDKLAISICNSTNSKFDKALFEKLNQDKILQQELFDE